MNPRHTDGGKGDEASMPRIMAITRYHKARHGGVVATTTNCQPVIAKLASMTNRANCFGYIARKTQKEAEKDPTP